MHRLTLLVLLLIGFSSAVSSQEKSMWNTLAKVTVETKFDEILNYDVEEYTFSKEVKELNGKKVTLEGWMIPLDELRGENYFVLSSLPFANCFFCGGAGPETVAEVFTKKDMKFTEDRIKVTGILTVNSDDPLKLMYILNVAEVTEF